MKTADDRPAFTYETTVTMHDADAAGVLFFARYLTLAHDAYEAFMASRGVSFAELIREGEFVLPVIHAECHYRAPLMLGEKVTVTGTIERVRPRAFSIAYQLYTADGRLAATVRTEHAAVSKSTGKAIHLPPKLVEALRPVISQLPRVKEDLTTTTDMGHSNCI